MLNQCRNEMIDLWLDLAIEWYWNIDLTSVINDETVFKIATGISCIDTYSCKAIYNQVKWTSKLYSYSSKIDDAMSILFPVFQKKDLIILILFYYNLLF